ncbi:MAG: hypothetical protein ACOC9R_01495 [bacterium]
MNLAALMAVRVQATLDELAALKARTPSEVRTEARLRERLAGLLGEIVRRVDEGVGSRGLPGGEVTARQLLGDLSELEVQLVEVLGEEVGEEAARAIAAVERKVAAARKQLPFELGALPEELRPYGMDRKLFDSLRNLAGRMLNRFTERTVERLVDAADVRMPREQLRRELQERLQGELQQLSRHTVVDARNEATVVAERDLGVRRHMWVTSQDDRVRDAHRIHGEVVEVGQRFSNGWERPGGLGCRCRLEPVVEDAA